MATRHIGKCNESDIFYRYKMPSMIFRLQGRGNGCKTSIVNLSAIAKSLDRDISLITKFLCKKLGTPATISKTFEVSIRGHHSTEILNDVIDNFIDECVLCSHCDNPETSIANSKKHFYLICKACGGRTDIQNHTIAADILSKIIVKK